MPAGYSGTPLAKKLTLKDGMRVWFDSMPESIRAEVDSTGVSLVDQKTLDQQIDAAHIFVKTAIELSEKLGELRNQIQPNGQVWVSWPKKASGLATEIAQDDVRKAGLAVGFVDTKKCAVDETWSGLKFVIRRELR